MTKPNLKRNQVKADLSHQNSNASMKRSCKDHSLKLVSSGGHVIDTKGHGFIQTSRCCAVNHIKTTLQQTTEQG